MFSKATLRLTAWYVVILMMLSLLFSVWLYAEGTHEVRAGLDAQLLRPYSNLLPRDDIVVFLNQQYSASQARIFGSLALMNIGVFAAGSLVSYFLARRTLQPIEDSLEAQNRFTADASHELRTPLTAMKTEIEVGLRNKTMSTSEARELLASNVEEINRLTALADGLLILARTGDAPQLMSIPLGEVSNKVVERFIKFAKAKHMTIRATTDDSRAFADAQQVDTILGILIDNAVKYGAAKSILTVLVAREDDKACLTVHNSGVPIASHDLSRIFDRFYRADSSRAGGKLAGYGLGLSIAHKLASSMNGTIAVKSSAKDGTTFTLRLPLA